jgi:hypothetical protein
MIRPINLATAFASLVLALAIFAQTEPSTSVSLPPGPIKVTINTVQGIVQYRTGPDQKWQKAAEGVELSEGAELRTGPRSAVKFMIGDDQTVTLDRLGTIQILRANFENGKVFTDLGMKYGRTRYDIESTARDHDAKVRSPSSVLAVRGTKFISEDEPPFAATAVSLDGRVMFRDAHKLVSVGNKGQGKTRVDTEHDSPAKTALKSTTIIPAGKFVGASDEEAERLISNGYGGYENYGVFALLQQARLQNFPLIAVVVIEQLNFGMSWNGSTTSNVDLQVIEPNGTITDKNHTSNLRGYQVTPPNNTFSPGFGQVSINLPAFSTGTFTVNVTRTTPGAVTGVAVNATRDPTGQANDFSTIQIPPFDLASQSSKTIKLKIVAGQEIQDISPQSSSAVKIASQSRGHH